MKRTWLLLIASGAILPAQEFQFYDQQIQDGQLQVTPGGRGGRGVAIPLPRTETGKPFSATVKSEAVQTLTDGTHITQTTTMTEYRDAEGRVRTENQSGITIRDVVGGVTYHLTPATKTATSVRTVPAPTGGARGRGGTVSADGLSPQAALELENIQKLRDQAIAQAAGRGARGGAGSSADTGRSAADQAAYEAGREYQRSLDLAQGPRPNETMEDLGTTVLNGVPVRGTRTTTIVPVGAIGNDKELRSVTERWFSSDLNLLVKSVSSDPRFGTTTYELTNIKRDAPDPSLFKVPSDYTIVTGGRGRGQ